MALIILGGAVAFNLYQEYGRIADREQERLTAQARVIAENLERQLVSACRALDEVRGEHLHGTAASVPRTETLRLKALINTMMGIRTLNIMDAQGKITASNRPEIIGTDLSYRDYFQVVKQHPEPDTLYVSPPFKTLLGAFAITLSRVIPGPRGEFAGIVTATLDPEYFRTLMASVLYTPDMWDAIGHGDGLLFLMVPEREELQGTNLAQPGSFFNKHRDSGQVATVLSGKVYATGEMRMMAQRTIQPVALKMDKPLVVSISRDLYAVFQPWYRDAMIQAGLFVLVAGVSIFGLYLYQRYQLISERQAADIAAALQQSAERLQLATEASGIGVWDYDIESKALVWDDSMYTIYGIDKSAVANLYEAWYASVLPEDMPAQTAALQATIEHGTPYTPCFRIRRGDGSLRYIQARARVYSNADGKAVRMVGTNEDITVSRTTLEKLELQANQDYLTGLSNRRHFMEQGEIELARVQRYGEALSAFMLDIDHFKNINDTYGHKTGDIVLQQLGHVLRETLRTVDIIGRIGGEEFAVLLPETDLQEAVEIAERLREIIAHTDVVLEPGLPLHFTVSIGVAMLKESDVNLDILLNLADKALYQAKESGRDKVCVLS
ncbi:MAG TPA: diguanylate cyclase [Gallionellaceae bacterium]|nr:diguanylate cyclase [Gallionellaceae bacterium]